VPKIKLLTSDLPLEYHISNVVDQFLCHFSEEDRGTEKESLLQSAKDNRNFLACLDPVAYLCTLAEKILEEKGLL
jgi:hypothetical protein